MIAFQTRNQKRISFSHIDTAFFTCLLSGLRSRPYTGTCAIAELLRFNIQELYVVGIDFYTYGYAKFYRQISEKDVAHLRNNHIHQREPQIDLVKRFYLLDKRFVVDQVLDQILLEPYDTFFHTLQKQFTLAQVLVTAKHHYIGAQHLLLKLLEPTKNKKNVYILGERSMGVKNADFIIDIAPFRKNVVHSNLVILSSPEQFVPAHYESHQSVLLLKPYHKEVSHQESIFPLKHLFYFHPTFLHQLEVNLRKHILPQGHLTPSLFVTLFFTLFLEKTCQIYVSGIDTFSSWHQNDRSKLHQRLLHKYLQKRGWLLEDN